MPIRRSFRACYAHMRSVWSVRESADSVQSERKIPPKNRSYEKTEPYQVHLKKREVKEARGRQKRPVENSFDYSIIPPD